MYNDGYVPQGWQCPKCKRIYSPELPTCIFCNNDRQKSADSEMPILRQVDRPQTNQLWLMPELWKGDKMG